MKKVVTTVLMVVSLGLLTGCSSLCGKCKLCPFGKKAAKEAEALCVKCGEIKGSEKCCKAEGREKCPKCGLFKGSPGCCKKDK